MKNWTDEECKEYLRIAHIIGNILPFVSGLEFKMITFLFSRTLGHQQDSIPLTLPDFYAPSRGLGVGFSRASVIRCIASLLERGLISRTEGRKREGFMYRIEVNAIIKLDKG